MNLRKLDYHLSDWAFLYVIITYLVLCLFINADYAKFGIIAIGLFYIGLICLVSFLANHEEKQERDYDKKCDEFFGSSVGPRTTIKAPDTPPPLPMHKGAILAKGTVEVVSNKTTDKKLSDGSVYHEQTIEFSINKPLDYMAIMGTKRIPIDEIILINKLKNQMQWITRT